jgi:hypothetical protein
MVLAQHYTKQYHSIPLQVYSGTACTNHWKHAKVLLCSNVTTMMIMVWLLWSTAHTRTEGPIQVLTALSRQLVGQKERLKCCYWLMMTHTTARKAPHDHLHPP